MQAIPLNLLSLYADIEQRVKHAEVAPASISRKTVKGRVHLYAVTKQGAVRVQTYIGPADDADALTRAEAHVRAARQRAQLKRSVQALKRAGIRAPDVTRGRILEALALAGLFRDGAVLVGTIAYQHFPCLVGAYLSDGAAHTEDADLAATRVGLERLRQGENLLTTLRRADPTFAPVHVRPSSLPRQFASEQGFVVEVLTTRGRSDETVPIPALGCVAKPLPYLEYLLEDAVEVVSLYGAGVLIRVPDPARYAVHKLIVHQVRNDAAKKIKDLAQARELFAAYRARDPDHLDDAIESAIMRGRAWAQLVRAGLKRLDGKV